MTTHNSNPGVDAQILVRMTLFCLALLVAPVVATQLGGNYWVRSSTSPCSTSCWRWG
jgi:branched-chain amino acid transport system permease protein